jgi:hypothetical protein
MDVEVKAEFDDIKKMLGDIANQLAAGGGAAAPVQPVGTLIAAPFGRIKRHLDALDGDDIVLVPAHRALDLEERRR